MDNRVNGWEEEVNAVTLAHVAAVAGETRWRRLSNERTVEVVDCVERRRKEGDGSLCGAEEGEGRRAMGKLWRGEESERVAWGDER